MINNGIIFMVLAVFSAVFMGCVHIESLAGSRSEPSCLWKNYKLKVDCYVVRPNWKEKTLVLSPDQAVYEGLPLPVDKQHVGKTFQGDLIVGVMKHGAEFRVVDVKRLSSYEYNILMPYVQVICCEFNDNMVFNAYRLFSHDTGVLDIIPKYAEQVK